MNPDTELLARLQTGSSIALKELIYSTGEDLLIFAYLQLRNAERANQVVQSVFDRLQATAFVGAALPLFPYLRQEVEQACSLATGEPSVLASGRRLPTPLPRR